MNDKFSGSPNFFLFRGEGYAYLNGPPVSHERLAQRSRHSLVGKKAEYSLSAVFVVVAALSLGDFGLPEPRLLPNTFSRHRPPCFRQKSHRCVQTEYSELNSRPK